MEAKGVNEVGFRGPGAEGCATAKGHLTSHCWRVMKTTVTIINLVTLKKRPLPVGNV